MASGWLLRLVAIPLNTATLSADPSWKEVVIRAAANPACSYGKPAFAAVCTPAYARLAERRLLAARRSITDGVAYQCG